MRLPVILLTDFGGFDPICLSEDLVLLCHLGRMDVVRDLAGGIMIDIKPCSFLRAGLRCGGLIAEGDRVIGVIIGFIGLGCEGLGAGNGAQEFLGCVLRM